MEVFKRCAELVCKLKLTAYLALLYVSLMHVVD